MLRKIVNNQWVWIISLVALGGIASYTLFMHIQDDEQSMHEAYRTQKQLEIQSEVHHRKSEKSDQVDPFTNEVNLSDNQKTRENPNNLEHNTVNKSANPVNLTMEHSLKHSDNHEKKDFPADFLKAFRLEFQSLTQ